jgi:hypothetical protein
MFTNFFILFLIIYKTNFFTVVRRLVLWGVLELASPLSPSPSSGITRLNILTAIHQDLVMHQRTIILAETCYRSFANFF